MERSWYVPHCPGAEVSNGVVSGNCPKRSPPDGCPNQSLDLNLMPVQWERIRNSLPEDFRASNGDEVVGRVYQIPHGPGQGLWFWTMTATRPGPRITFATNGRVAHRGDAGRRVVEAYEKLLQCEASHPDQPWS